MSSLWVSGDKLTFQTKGTRYGGIKLGARPARGPLNSGHLLFSLNSPRTDGASKVTPSL